MEKWNKPLQGHAKWFDLLTYNYYYQICCWKSVAPSYYTCNRRSSPPPPPPPPHGNKVKVRANRAVSLCTQRARYNVHTAYRINIMVNCHCRGWWTNEPAVSTVLSMKPVNYRWTRTSCRASHPGLSNFSLSKSAATIRKRFVEQQQ